MKSKYDLYMAVENGEKYRNFEEYKAKRYLYINKTLELLNGAFREAQYVEDLSEALRKSCFSEKDQSGNYVADYKKANRSIWRAWNKLSKGQEEDI